jgi:hypothetical protein
MRRPLVITLLALAMLSLAGLNAWRAVLAIQIQQLDFLREYDLGGPQTALTLTGLLWAFGFGALAVGLFRLKRRARRWTLAAMVLYQVNLWLIRLAFERSSIEPLTRPADAAISILGILLVWAILWWPRVRRAFV